MILSERGRGREGERERERERENTQILTVSITILGIALSDIISPKMFKVVYLHYKIQQNILNAIF